MLSGELMLHCDMMYFRCYIAPIALQPARLRKTRGPKTPCVGSHHLSRLTNALRPPSALPRLLCVRPRPFRVLCLTVPSHAVARLHAVLLICGNNDPAQTPQITPLNTRNAHSTPVRLVREPQPQGGRMIPRPMRRQRSHDAGCWMLSAMAMAPWLVLACLCTVALAESSSSSSTGTDAQTETTVIRVA